MNQQDDMQNELTAAYRRIRELEAERGPRPMRVVIGQEHSKTLDIKTARLVDGSDIQESLDIEKELYCGVYDYVYMIDFDEHGKPYEWRPSE